MPFAVGVQGIVELLQQILLLSRQFDRGLDLDTAVQISGRMTAHRSHAFAADAEHPARL